MTKEQQEVIANMTPKEFAEFMIAKRYTADQMKAMVKWYNQTRKPAPQAIAAS